MVMPKRNTVPKPKPEAAKPDLNRVVAVPAEEVPFVRVILLLCFVLWMMIIGFVMGVTAAWHHFHVR